MEVLYLDDFIDPEDIEGKFDIDYDYVKTRDYEDRLTYVRNTNNLSDELVHHHQMQDEVLK